jgi:polar amino acid transport system substrate-binding protein
LAQKLYGCRVHTETKKGFGGANALMGVKSNRLPVLGLPILIIAFGPVQAEQLPDRQSFSVVYDSFAQFIDRGNGGATGLYVDIITEAVENRLNTPLEFIWQPWQRAQFSAKNGIVDAMITVATDARLDYSEAGNVPVALSRIRLFTTAGHPRFERMRKIETLQDLQNYRILTYLGDGWARQFLSELEVDYGSNDLENVFRKLAWGRGDIFPQIGDVTRHYISELDFEDTIVEVTGVELGHIEFRLMISKQSPFLKMLPDIDAALQDMWQDGTMERLAGKYGYD